MNARLRQTAATKATAMTTAASASPSRGPSPPVARDLRGDLEFDASDLALRFNLPTDVWLRQIAAGLVRSRVEIGQDEDQGRRRVSLRAGNRLWRAILDAEGRIESEQMTFVQPRSGAAKE